MAAVDAATPTANGQTTLHGASDVLAHSLLSTLWGSSDPAPAEPNGGEVPQEKPAGGNVTAPWRGKGWVEAPDFPKGRKAPPANTGRVGLYFTTFPEGAQVVHLVEGGSAQKSGQIRIGDMILSINGKSTAEQNVDSIRGMLNGAPGTQVVLVLRVFEAVSNKLDPANPVDVSQLKTVCIERVRGEAIAQVELDVQPEDRYPHRRLQQKQGEKTPAGPAQEDRADPAAAPVPDAARDRLELLELENDKLRELMARKHIVDTGRGSSVPAPAPAPAPTGYLFLSVLAAENLPSSLWLDLAGLVGYFCSVQVVARGADAQAGTVRHSFRTHTRHGTLRPRFEQTFVIPVDCNPTTHDVLITMLEEETGKEATRALDVLVTKHQEQVLGGEQARPIGQVTFPLDALCGRGQHATATYDLSVPGGARKLYGTAPGHCSQVLLSSEYLKAAKQR